MSYSQNTQSVVLIVIYIIEREKKKNEMPFRLSERGAVPWLTVYSYHPHKWDRVYLVLAAVGLVDIIGDNPGFAMITWL